MKYTRLGKTGLEVSRICLGCMSYGDPNWRPWVLDEETARPHFKRALEHGINFFDTADMYSLGVSEEVTGRALGSMAPRDDYVLASKVHFPFTKGQIGAACHANTSSRLAMRRSNGSGRISSISTRSTAGM